MLDERKQRVLQAIIEDYILTALPVGSRTIARKYGLGVSSATIRNEMADLEEMGYLEQPHTSAGRVPSDKGYRFYVDWLMKSASLSEEHLRRIHKGYQKKAREIESLIQETIKVLSEITDYMTVVLGPQISRTKLEQIHFLNLSANSALFVVVTTVGFVDKCIVDIPESITAEELELISEVMTYHLKGKSVEDITRSTLSDIRMDLGKYQDFIAASLDLLEYLLNQRKDERVWVGGKTNILNQPEFQSIEKARAVFSVIDQEELVRDLLSAATPGSIHVSIGGENRIEEVQDCSLISATFRIGTDTYGKIGIIGPKRMDYSHTVAVLECVEKALSEVLCRVIGA